MNAPTDRAHWEIGSVSDGELAHARGLRDVSFLEFFGPVLAISLPAAKNTDAAMCYLFGQSVRLPGTSQFEQITLV